MKTAKAQPRYETPPGRQHQAKYPSRGESRRADEGEVRHSGLDCLLKTEPQADPGGNKYGEEKANSRMAIKEQRTTALVDWDTTSRSPEMVGVGVLMEADDKSVQLGECWER
jgi:hypothetical protein